MILNFKPKVQTLLMKNMIAPQLDHLLLTHHLRLQILVQTNRTYPHTVPHTLIHHHLRFDRVDMTIHQSLVYCTQFFVQFSVGYHTRTVVVVLDAETYTHYCRYEPTRHE